MNTYGIKALKKLCGQLKKNEIRYDIYPVYHGNRPALPKIPAQSGCEIYQKMRNCNILLFYNIYHSLVIKFPEIRLGY